LDWAPIFESPPISDAGPISTEEGGSESGSETETSDEGALAYTFKSAAPRNAWCERRVEEEGRETPGVSEVFALLEAVERVDALESYGDGELEETAGEAEDDAIASGAGANIGIGVAWLKGRSLEGTSAAVGAAARDEWARASCFFSSISRRRERSGVPREWCSDVDASSAIYRAATVDAVEDGARSEANSGTFGCC